jgi:hypothetical protein
VREKKQASAACLVVINVQDQSAGSICRAIISRAIISRAGDQIRQGTRSTV